MPASLQMTRIEVGDAVRSLVGECFSSVPGGLKSLMYKQMHETTTWKLEVGSS